MWQNVEKFKVYEYFCNVLYIGFCEMQCLCFVCNTLSFCFSLFIIFLQFLLECPDDILAFQFSPSNPNIIVGGCLNGQVIFFFLRYHLSCFLYSEKFKIISFFTQVYSLAHYKILLSFKYYVPRSAVALYWLILFVNSCFRFCCGTSLLMSPSYRQHNPAVERNQ